MKRTLLLSSAVIALSLGLTPAMAQQDRTDSKMKHDPAATEQHDRNTSKQPRNEVRKDDAGAAGQTSDHKAKAAETDKAKSGADSSKAAQKSADEDKAKAAQPKQAQDKASDQGRKPAEKAATDKPNTAAPSKSAEQNKSGTPDAQKSTRSSEPDRNASADKSTADQKTRISASLDAQKKTRVTTAFSKVDVKPVTNVNFSISVGTVVPSHVHFRPVPSTIVEIVPQYRGYDFFVVREEIVIVEPRTHRIVDVIERGPSRSHAETTTVRKPQLSSQQREIIRKHARTRRTTTTTTTTGSSPRTEIEIGHRLPDSVEIESFPEEVYREVPAVREYRYIERGSDVYLVDPSSRMVIEEVR